MNYIVDVSSREPDNDEGPWEIVALTSDGEEVIEEDIETEEYRDFLMREYRMAFHSDEDNGTPVKWRKAS